MLEVQAEKVSNCSLEEERGGLGAESPTVCSFICQVGSVRRQRNYVPCPSSQQANLPGYFHIYPFLMLNVKQGSCDYQRLKSFGLSLPGNRTQVEAADAQTTRPALCDFYIF